MYKTTVRVRCLFVGENEFAHRVTVYDGNLVWRTGWLGKGLVTLARIDGAGAAERWATMPQWLAIDYRLPYERLEPQPQEEPARP